MTDPIELAIRETEAAIRKAHTLCLQAQRDLQDARDRQVVIFKRRNLDRAIGRLRSAADALDGTTRHIDVAYIVVGSMINQDRAAG